MSDDTDERQESGAVAKTALSIAATLAGSDPGEKAQARRMDQDGAPLFWRLAARLEIRPADESNWLRFTRMVALLTPATQRGSIHDKDRPLGAALAEAGVSELRLARLLAARGDARLEALERAIRALSRANPKLNVVDLAWAVLKDNPRNLARDYYRSHDHSKAPETENV